MEDYACLPLVVNPFEPRYKENDLYIAPIKYTKLPKLTS